MTCQTSLFNSDTPDNKELLFLNQIFPMLAESIEASGGSRSLISFKPTKSNNKSSGYTSVYCGNFTIFRIKLRNGQQYIALPVIFRDLIPQDYPVKDLKSDFKYFRLLVDEQHPVESYASILSVIAGETVSRYPKEWDCCSRFKECSDAKACVHPDKVFSLGCGYKKILNSGTIFYGKNRTVD